MLRRSLGFSLLLAAGCGGAAASAPPPAPALTAPVPAPAQGRGPSPELAKRFPFAARPPIVGYADIAGLRATDLAGIVAEALAPIVGPAGDDPTFACAKAIWGSTRELVAGGTDGALVAVLRFDGAPPLTACSAVLGPPGGHVEGASQAFDAGDWGVVAVQGDVMAVGTTDLVTAAFKGAGTGAALTGMALDPDEYVRAFVDVKDPPVTGHASIVAAREKFLLALEGEVPPGFVELAAATVARGRSAFAGNAAALRLFDAVSIKQTGKTARASFELDEAPAEQARDLGDAVGLGIGYLRRYLAEAKRAEAAIVSADIATHLSDWVDHENAADPKHHAKVRLFSLPPVPAAVPSGTKFQSSHADWKDWAKIGFEMTDPQYFQYEVKAAKDGQSADIVARGDLSGDGKEQRFTLHVTFDRAAGRLVVPTEVTEDKPHD